MPFSLGKRPFVPDRRDITFAAVREGLTLPTPPKNFGLGTIYKDGEDPKLGWDMNGNGPDPTSPEGAKDGVGDCVLATFAHLTRAINKSVGRTVVITGRESVSDYSACTGYVVGDENTDQGTDMRQAMSYWRNTGILDAAGNRHKIGAFVSLTNDIAELAQAAYVFSGVAVGFNFQRSQYSQFDVPATETPVWDYVAGEQFVGGHAIPFVGRNRKRLGGVSWARHLYCTAALVANQVDEAWAFVTLEELKNGRTRLGMDLAGLNAALAAI